MRAIRCNQYGPPDSLTLEELPDLTPAAGQVVIDVKAAAVNFPDVLIIENKYQVKPPLPFTPGAEVAGIVRAAGEGVALQPGTRVAAYVGYGGFAQQVLADAGACVTLPDHADFATAARSRSRTARRITRSSIAAHCAQARRCSCSAPRAAWASRRSRSARRSAHA
jgi:NADPH2:quinone reductase